MTDLLKDLEAVTLLADKATPGEWRAWDDLDGDYAKVEGSPDGPNIANTGRLGWPEAKDNAAYITALSNLFRTHHAEIAEALKLARGEREEAWEIWQDDMCVAGSDSTSDAKHYLMMYGQDGPVRLVRVVSYCETITQEQIDTMHNSAREDGE